MPMANRSSGSGSTPIASLRVINGVNPFDYLKELQRHAGELKREPSEWMPWY